MSKSQKAVFQSRIKFGLVFIACSPASATGGEPIAVLFSVVVAAVFLPIKVTWYRSFLVSAGKDLFGFSQRRLEGANPWVRIIIGFFSFVFISRILGCMLGFHGSPHMEFKGQSYCFVDPLTSMVEYGVGNLLSWILTIEILCLANQKRPKLIKYMVFLLKASVASTLVNAVPLAIYLSEPVSCIVKQNH